MFNNAFEVIATIRRDQELKNNIEDYLKRIKYLMLDLNVTAFRINVGKWDTKEFGTLIEDVKLIRTVADENNKNITIILDLPFPGKKARVITYVKKIDYKIKKNRLVEIYSATEYELGRIINQRKNDRENDRGLIFGITVQNVGEKVKVGDKILYADGEGLFEVASIDSPNKITAIAMNNFKLDNSKSIHFQNSVHMAKLDDTVIELVKKINPDVIALSFVEDNSSVKEMRRVLKEASLECDIMAKIESVKGVYNFDDILESVDSVMVARGDLGLYIDIIEFPRIVFDLIKKTKAKNKFVCVATGFMDTLVDQCVPSRSDIIDLYVMVNSEVDGVVFTYKAVRADNVMRVIVDIVNDWTSNGEVRDEP